MAAAPGCKWFVVALAAAGACASAAGRAAAATAVPGNWQPTWSAEFNGGQSDLSRWTYDLGGGGWGNGESEVYTNSAANASVSAGALHIDAVVTSGVGGSKSYTSARIKTSASFAQTYGLFEFRAKLPAGQGLWPAIWMMPRDSAYGGWPTSGEIDVLESVGQNTGLVQGSLHSGTSPGTQDTQTRTFAQSGLEPAGFSTTDWHTYDLQWQAGTPTRAGVFRWYVDGTLYETQSGGWVVPAGNPPDAPFNKPFYLIINLAVGGSYGGTPNLSAGTYEMQVDYARAYRIMGDATGDGQVNSSDLALVLGNYNKAVAGGYAAGDFNADGRVDAGDLAIYDAARAGVAAQSADGLVTGVPEPGAIGMLACASAMACRRLARRRLV